MIRSLRILLATALLAVATVPALASSTPPPPEFVGEWCKVPDPVDLGLTGSYDRGTCFNDNVDQVTIVVQAGRINLPSRGWCKLTSSGWSVPAGNGVRTWHGLYRCRDGSVPVGLYMKHHVLHTQIGAP